MAYHLIPNNEAAGEFDFGAFSFPVLLEACGYLFSSIHRGGQWYCAFGNDPRMGDTYPTIMTNDGFAVTEEEARIMARIARNVVLIQRTLPDENLGNEIASKAEFRRDDVEKLLILAMNDQKPGPWPIKMRTAFVDRFEKFAEWAEKSGGFEIW